MMMNPDHDSKDKLIKKQPSDDDDDDNDDEGGGEGGMREMDMREQDRFLPIANIARIMKTQLPGNAKIAKDAKESIQECVSEFISFITSEASDKCLQEKRKTINGDDILWAMSTLGFDKYIEPLKTYLTKYRESVKNEKPEKKPTEAALRREAKQRAAQEAATTKPPVTISSAGGTKKSGPGSASKTPTGMGMMGSMGNQPGMMQNHNMGGIYSVGMNAQMGAVGGSGQGLAGLGIGMGMGTTGDQGFNGGGGVGQEQMYHMSAGGASMGGMAAATGGVNPLAASMPLAKRPVPSTTQLPSADFKKPKTT